MLAGAANFRAVKPYAGANGRRLRPRVLFRSGELSRLSEADLATLAALKIRLVCDLRSAAEQAEYVSRWPDGSGHAWLDLPGLETTNASPDKIFAMVASQPGEAGAVAAMDMLYRRKPRAFAGNLKILLEAILTGDALPLLVHCHAGKDRTGFMIAMILAAIGVSRADILDDYVETGRFFLVEAETPAMVEWAHRTYGHRLTHVAAAPMVEARAGYMGAALDVIDTEWGGIEAYLDQAVGFGPVQRTQLQALLLE